MSREGVGSDGPPVLQFVWGQRVFGPCVIQNIRVRERSWDTGILVNAEVSFELEQVPEWVINDGFVDIARPGKQSTVNDPTLPGRTEEQPPPGGAGETGDKEEIPKKDQPGGGGGNNTGDLSQCRNLNSDSKKWEAFEKRVEAKKSGVKGLIATGQEIPGTGLPSSQRFGVTGTFRDFANEYLNLRNTAQSNSFYGSQIRVSTVGFECVNFQRVIDSYNGSVSRTRNISAQEFSKQNADHNQKIIVCSRNIKSIIDKTVVELKCAQPDQLIGPLVPERLR
jgi:hypothetical protein